jgi:hypothetical protein
MNGNHALMGVQQINEELVQKLWQMCDDLNLVLSDILIINRENWKTIYSFQTLTLPYFTALYHEWYQTIDGKRYKVLPSTLDILFTPLAFAFELWVTVVGIHMVNVLLLIQIGLLIVRLKNCKIFFYLNLILVLI